MGRMQIYLNDSLFRTLDKSGVATFICIIGTSKYGYVILCADYECVLNGLAIVDLLIMVADSEANRYIY